MNPEPGTTLGDYRLLKPLGRGGMGHARFANTFGLVSSIVEDLRRASP